MSTTYIIKPGYNANFPEKEVWEELKKVIDNIQNNPEKIAYEIFKTENDLEGEYSPKIKLIWETIEYYRKPVSDLTIKIIEESQMIYQIASGGGIERKVKESCRRAVCRLALKAMHQKQMEISITVN